jgi:mutual gliding-motility protein MglA
MSFVDPESSVLHCKIVYWGVGLAGKQTTLMYIHARLPEERKSKLTSLASATERVLF